MSTATQMVKNIDTQVTLPVLMRELDHIQAIIGRYDTFFFLMKQLCFGAVSTLIVFGLNKQFSSHMYIYVIPTVFYLFEYMFRYWFWSGFILRVLKIEKFLNEEVAQIRLYALNDTSPVIPRIMMSFKPFDIVFYAGVAAIVAIFGP